MKFGWKRTILGAVITVSVYVGGAAAPQAGTPQMAEDVFQNIQVLKGLSVDEFMSAMEMFTAALGYDCTDCHGSQALSNIEGFSVPTARIGIGRAMIQMMRAINKQYFGGVQRVTCFTCHSGNYIPVGVPDLALQYGPPPENPNRMDVLPDARASADAILDRYFEALGGEEALANLTSFTATGTYAGIDTGFVKVPMEIFAKAPDQRTQIIHGAEGDNVQTYDGENGWTAGPKKAVPVMTLTGGNLFGARMDARVHFPAGLRQEFRRWQASHPVEIEGKLYDLVQASNTGELPINLYFDESGLLKRLVRWNETAVGILPAQVDFSDYREVNGVKVPFRWDTLWTGGQTTIQLEELQPNVRIDVARFAKPAPGGPRR